VASEILFGASPAWQDSSCILLPAAASVTESPTMASSTMAAAAAELPQCAALLLEVLSDEQLCGLPTHVEAAAAAAGAAPVGGQLDRRSSSAGPDTAAQQWTPQAGALPAACPAA